MILPIEKTIHIEGIPVMYKDYRYINAGQNEIHRYGKKAVQKASESLIPNAAGYYSIPVDGGRYWSIGTSEGKYGEYAKFNGTFFSVNSAGNMYAKVGTEKAEKIFAEHAEEIGEETLAVSVTKAEPAGYVKEWKINGENVTLGVERK